MRKLLRRLLAPSLVVAALAHPGTAHAQQYQGYWHGVGSNLWSFGQSAVNAVAELGYLARDGVVGTVNVPLAAIGCGYDFNSWSGALKNQEQNYAGYSYWGQMAWSPVEASKNFYNGTAGPFVNVGTGLYRDLRDDTPGTNTENALGGLFSNVAMMRSLPKGTGIVRQGGRLTILPMFPRTPAGVGTLVDPRTPLTPAEITALLESPEFRSVRIAEGDLSRGEVMMRGADRSGLSIKIDPEMPLPGETIGKITHRGQSFIVYASERNLLYLVRRGGDAYIGKDGMLIPDVPGGGTIGATERFGHPTLLENPYSRVAAAGELASESVQGGSFLRLNNQSGRFEAGRINAKTPEQLGQLGQYLTEKSGGKVQVYGPGQAPTYVPPPPTPRGRVCLPPPSVGRRGDSFLEGF